MHFAKTLVLGTLLAGLAPGVLAQATPATGAGAKPATPPAAAKATPQAAKPAASAPSKPAAQAAAKPTVKAPAKPAAKSAAKKPAKPAAPAAAASVPAEAENKVSRRDPFESLVGRQKAAADAAKNLPPGKAGLQVSTLRLDGVVKAPNGMIAVVTNPQSRTYFLREGDQLYDGRVEKIAMDGVSFHETGKDAFGKPVERQVNKRIYSSAGEQQ
ncbi:MAG TPA: pilus assembly protein PilP [Candidatus Acidoferrum sp.]|nr:pilus assembly protein PilP [Candidatus Acidoferrum sp.]